MGILAVFHGCSHSATDFFAPSRKCSSCLALPEEVRITNAALAQGYIVLAISSTDRHTHRCWNFEVDGPMVKDALEAFRFVHSLPEEPLVALGASSGGAFALMLPSLVPRPPGGGNLILNLDSLVRVDDLPLPASAGFPLKSVNP